MLEVELIDRTDELISDEDQLSGAALTNDECGFAVMNSGEVESLAGMISGALTSCTSPYNPGFKWSSLDKVTLLFWAFIANLRVSTFLLSIEIKSSFPGARYKG